MMLAALFGAMTLGACVDNEESQSVTDIRDAKTEELKSLAALNNAQAEAAKIAANADAALKAAQAAYQQALAEQVKANTALIEVNTQLAEINVQLKQVELEEARVELERKQAQLLADKANYEKQIALAKAAIAKAEAELEVYLAQQEYQLLAAQQNLIYATKDLELAQKIDYMSLYNTYSIAVSNLNSAKSMLVRAQKNYTATEEGIIADEEAYAETIEYYKEAIAETEEQIALYQTRVDAFAEYVTLTDEELEAKIAEKEAEYFPAYTAYQLAYNAANDYLKANPRPSFPEEVTRYREFMNNWYSALANGLDFGAWNYSWDIGLEPLRFNEETNSFGYYLPNADPYYYDYYPVFEKDDELGWAPYAYEWVDVEYTFEGCEDVETVSYVKYSPNKGAWKVNEENFNAYLKMWGQNLTNEDNNWALMNLNYYQGLVDELEKRANSTEKASEGEFTLYKNALEAYVKAKEEREAAKKKANEALDAYSDVEDSVKDLSNPTDAEKKALEDADKAYQAAVEAFQKANADFYAAQDALAEARTNKINVEEEIEMYKSQIEEYAHWNDVYTTDYEDVCAQYEQLKEWAAIADDEKTYEEWNNWYAEWYASEEYVAHRTTTHAYNHINTDIEALREAYAADDDYESVVNFWNSQIEILEGDIEYCNEQIVAYEEAIADPNHEETLARLQEAIEMAELRVAAAQKAADEAKAKLDAALAE